MGSGLRKTRVRPSACRSRFRGHVNRDLAPSLVRQSARFVAVVSREPLLLFEPLLCPALSESSAAITWQFSVPWRCLIYSTGKPIHPGKLSRFNFPGSTIRQNLGTKSEHLWKRVMITRARASPGTTPSSSTCLRAQGPGRLNSRPVTLALWKPMSWLPWSSAKKKNQVWGLGSCRQLVLVVGS